MIQARIIPNNPPLPYDGPVMVYLPHHWFPEGRAFRLCDDIADAIALRNDVQSGMIPDVRYR